MPLILLRHAEAAASRNRADRAAAATWPGRSTRAAPPTRKPWPALLASYGRCQVISSAAERCLATVRPYAQAVGVPVEVEPALTVVPGPISAAALVAAATARDGSVVRDIHGAAARPGETPAAGQAATLAAELAASGEPTLVCAHRENLPAIIAGGGHGAGRQARCRASRSARASSGSCSRPTAVLIAAERHDLAALASPSKRGPRLAPIVGGAR